MLRNKVHCMYFIITFILYFFGYDFNAFLYNDIINLSSRFEVFLHVILLMNCKINECCYVI